MESPEPSSSEPIIICNKKLIENKKKNRQRTIGKLKKCGFDADDLSKQFRLNMNVEGFEEVARQQLDNYNVISTIPNFEKLPLMQAFKDELTLDRRIWSTMEHHEFSEPLPVQAITIPYIQQYNADIIVKAETGSGKTMAFLLPIIDYIVKVKSSLANKAPNQDAPYAVIVAPTRELVIQIAREATQLVTDSNAVKVTFGVGDMHSNNRERALKLGCDIAVLTPGFLYNYFAKKEPNETPKFRTDNIRFVVLDEVDKLLEKDRRRENDKCTLPPTRNIIYDFIVSNLTEEKKKTDFNVLLFSATINDVFLYKLIMPQYIRIEVGLGHVVSTVKQEFLEIRPEDEKLKNLMDIIDCIAEHYNEDFNPLSVEKKKMNIGRTIIFVNCIRLSERINTTLNAKGFLVGTISSCRSQAQRTQTLQDMVRGGIDIVVATDVLARGLNIPKVEFVINYDCPRGFTADEYMHRVGRCGRIGNVGRSITFIDPKIDYKAAPALIAGCKATNLPIPDVLLKCQSYYDDDASNSSYGSYSQVNKSNMRKYNGNSRY